jgi:enoyl-CoA hydratase/carnithine racemase
MSNTHILISDKDCVRTIRINRADKKNALSQNMYKLFTAALKGAEENDDIRVVIILGVPGAFSAGNDMADFMRASDPASIAPVILDFLHTLAGFKKPIVAAVDGLAIGIGTTMLMHCDYVLASPKSYFRTPFVDLGLVPEAGSSLLGPKISGYAKAFELLALGQAWSAEDAQKAGLINHIYDSESLESQAETAAKTLSAKPPQALMSAKALLKQNADDVHKRIDEEAELFWKALQSEEAQAAIQAFMTKSKGD